MTDLTTRISELEVALDKLVAEQKEQRRLLEQILSLGNLTYKDREIQVETHEAVIGLKERMIADRGHQDAQAQAIAAEVGDVKSALGENTVIVKANKQSIIDKIIKKVRGK